MYRLGFSRAQCDAHKNFDQLLEALKKNPETSAVASLLEEFGKRFAGTKLSYGEKFTRSEDVFNHFHFRIRSEVQEAFYILLLDNNKQFMKEIMVTKGIINRCLVHPREVFAPAIEARASAIICVHNHPSGNNSPSVEDHRITETLYETGEMLNISILDHLVVAGDSYTSFADSGFLYT